MSFDVRYSEAARSDLVRLYDHLQGRATTLEELDFADHAYEVIVGAVNSLERSPFISRKAGADRFVRELPIPFGNTGYVALFEIQDPSTVLILAWGHQLEDDYH